MTILFTGGTGFFGKSFLSFCKKRNLDIDRFLILSRNPKKFNNEFDINSFSFEITFIEQDIRYPLSIDESVDYIIHAASDSRTSVSVENPLLMSDVVVQGTKNVLEYARVYKVKRLLFISSGAVYGEQPSDLTNIPEDYAGSPDPLDPLNAYGCAKRQAENLCAIYNHHYGVDYVVARCFAFVGLYLPLDAHFAIGNFIRDGLNGGPIVVKGDGTPYRSYLYSVDLMKWLWTLLIQGECGEAYNVGSDEAVTIKDLAYKVSECFDSHPEVEIKQKLEPGRSPKRYAPCIKKVESNLSLTVKKPLTQAIHETIRYHSSSF